MKTMHTIISYEFYYLHGEPAFCSMSVAVFENNEIIHHHSMNSHEPTEFAFMAEKAKGEQAPAEPVDFSAPAEEEWFAIEDDVPPVPEEVPLTEIDGKDGEAWMREAAAYYEKEKYTRL